MNVFAVWFIFNRLSCYILYSKHFEGQSSTYTGYEMVLNVATYIPAPNVGITMSS